MIEDTLIANPTYSSAPLSLSSSTSSIPRDVLHKYEVEKNVNNSSIEELLLSKINDAVVEENEAFYIIDLNAVVRKHEEWTTNLPRVKPFFCNQM